MIKTKAVRFNCDLELLQDLDAHRSRYVSRTQMIEIALKNYLAALRREEKD